MDNMIASEAIDSGSTPDGDTSFRMSTANTRFFYIRKKTEYPVK